MYNFLVFSNILLSNDDTFPNYPESKFHPKNPATFTCSKSKVESLEKGVKHVQY